MVARADQYQRKTPLEHVLLRPDTYIGSTEKHTQEMWVVGDGDGLVSRPVSVVPGLYKIFDEIVVNAADHKRRDPRMDVLKIAIDADKNTVSVYNNGSGIDTSVHPREGVRIPTLIFGFLLTGANFDDSAKKVVGGRNGYGAKLCNIFSTRFVVETAFQGTLFKQVWKNNMTVAEEPVLRDGYTKEEFTRVTFSPDLARFGVASLDDDTVSLMRRRAYDLAGTLSGVKVYLDGKRVPVSGFRQYVSLYTDSFAYEQCNERWEVAVARSEDGFMQVSFVNAIATTKGGRHVDAVAGAVVDHFAELLRKKKVDVKPHNVKAHLWVFVNCLIENPAFDSQTKEALTTPASAFGSRCEITRKFYAAVERSTALVATISAWAHDKEREGLARSCPRSKQGTVRGIPKLNDANNAGTKKSMGCTLILTEGDSAKALAVAGISVVGSDNYGVYPLRGKLLNVRDATARQLRENTEINEMISIIGLRYDKKYERKEDLQSLRYGHVMIMADQDQDGSHIKGLVINFIHFNWPGLLRLQFLEEFITPIIKARSGRLPPVSFYSLPEYQEWLHGDPARSKWTPKYYKGLGTSTSQEAKEYFSALDRHRISFRYNDSQDDAALELAFSKSNIEARKQWLLEFMRSPDRDTLYLYRKDTREVSYKDFVDKELVLFSNLDNERSIPSVMDGLKPGQRKVLFVCFKRNDRKEVKVNQLSGAVAELSAYHHSEDALKLTIVGLAQDFVGSNNVNLLLPMGQFGTRLKGGKDHADPRYIHTMLNPVTELIFPPDDRPVLDYLTDENMSVEPRFYVPVLPMVLVNGAEGIGTGWSTKIPNYNPLEIIANIRRLLAGKKPRTMTPWFRGFTGTIERDGASRFVVSGISTTLANGKIEVTELPVRTWTNTYKESVLVPLMEKREVAGFKEYHTDTAVRFVITPECDAPDPLPLKLRTVFSTTSMVLFDPEGNIRRYESPEEILEEFFAVRLRYYGIRKEYMIAKLDAEYRKLENQARFIREKVDGTLRLEDIPRDRFVQVLKESGYESDPVKKWSGTATKEEDYDYLLDMPMRSMFTERKEELESRAQANKLLVSELQVTSPAQLWAKELDQVERALS